METSCEEVGKFLTKTLRIKLKVAKTFHRGKPEWDKNLKITLFPEEHG